MTILGMCNISRFPQQFQAFPTSASFLFSFQVSTAHILHKYCCGFNVPQLSYFAKIKIEMWVCATPHFVRYVCKRDLLKKCFVKERFVKETFSVQCTGLHYVFTNKHIIDWMALADCPAMSFLFVSSLNSTLGINRLRI